ncbi:MAG: DNA polymerase III subunit delta' [Gammaproteobacteria bacterium]|nr:DNA polymerase III subunit delta' [Gammaproteobacteria bacterium]
MTVYPWQVSRWEQLMSAVASNRLPHALLLEGPPGIGLSVFARTLAERLLCQNPGAGSACGNCNDCAMVSGGSHPDLVSIEPEEAGKQIRVDQVRELIDFIQLKSHSGRFKIAIIDPADAMNRSTANALLKTLEEPPGQSLLILNTHQAQRLPVTIRSRCQRIEFSLQRDAEIIEWLANRLGDDQDADTLLQLAGTPIAALEMAEANKIEQRDRIIEDLVAVRNKTQDPVSLGKAWSDMGAREVITWLQQLFADLLKLRVMENPPGIRNIDRAERLRLVLNGLDLRQLLACTQLLARIYAQLNSTVSYNSQALLEEFVYFWQTIDTSGGRHQ